MNLSQKNSQWGTSHRPNTSHQQRECCCVWVTSGTLKLGWEPAPRVLEQGGFEPVTRLLSALIPNMCKVAIKSK